MCLSPDMTFASWATSDPGPVRLLGAIRWAAQAEFTLLDLVSFQWILPVGVLASA